MSDRGPVGRWFDRILGVLVLATMGAVLAQPGGVVRVRIDRFLSERQVDAVLRDRWFEIAGSASAEAKGRHVLVAFMDYQCPFCRMAEDTLKAFAGAENIDVVYRHYPLTAIHPRAEEAARTAICAAEAGVFEPAHEYLIREQWWEDPAPLSSRSIELGITDVESFRGCLTSTRVDQLLARDRELGTLLRVRGTPLFVGPKGVHRGLIGTSDISGLLERPGRPRP